MGGGGSLLFPSGFRSFTGNVAFIVTAVGTPFRAGSGGANEGASGMLSSGDTRRDGSGGGTDGGRTTVERSWAIPFGGRDGGWDGNCVPGRGGGFGFGFKGGTALSLELLPFDNVRSCSPRFTAPGEFPTLRGGMAGGVVIACIISDRSDSVSENGLCEGEFELQGRSILPSV